MPSKLFKPGTIIDSSWLNDVNDLVFGIAQSAGASLVGFLQAGIGAVSRTLQAKARDTIDVRDYGASTTKTAAQNRTALQAAIAAVDLAGGGTIEVKNGINYGLDTRTISTYPDFSSCAYDVTVLDSGYATADGSNKAGAQTRVFFYTKQTSPAGMHDGNGYWLHGAWHPYLWVNNHANLPAVGDPSRTAVDNRRASLFFGNDGKATWRVGQGTLEGAEYTDEELSNFVIQIFDTGGEALGDVAPLLIERKTGNWSIGAGTNAPQAAIHVKNLSAGYPQAIFESLSSESVVRMRNSSGSGEDVSLRNVAGNFTVNFPGVGDGLEINRTTRRVGIGTSPDYRLDVRESRSSGFVLYAKNESATGGNVGILETNTAPDVNWSFLRMFAAGDEVYRLRGDGTAATDGSWNAGGADYAEYFEWEDGNPNGEDRRGFSVALVGNKIKPAAPGDTVIGVVSANPSMVGDSASTRWSGKYLRDEFGSYVLDENGERTVNPTYDPSQEYTPREQRKEWGCVGLVGKLSVRVGQPIGDRWVKMRDISETVEEWLIR